MEDLIQFVPAILIVGVFYFLVIRPQDQERKAQDALVASLAKDDRVVMKHGLHGRITKVEDKTIALDVGGRTVLTFDKIAVGARIDNTTDVAS